MGVFQSGDKYSVPRLHDVAATQGIGGSAQWSVPSTFDCPGDKKQSMKLKRLFRTFFLGPSIFAHMVWPYPSQLILSPVFSSSNICNIFEILAFILLSALFQGMPQPISQGYNPVLIISISLESKMHIFTISVMRRILAAIFWKTTFVHDFRSQDIFVALIWDRFDTPAQEAAGPKIFSFFFWRRNVFFQP